MPRSNCESIGAQHCGCIGRCCYCTYTPLTLDREYEISIAQQQENIRNSQQYYLGQRPQQFSVSPNWTVTSSNLAQSWWNDEVVTVNEPEYADDGSEEVKD